MSSSPSVWKVATDPANRGQRGFDDPACWLPHFAIPTPPARCPSRPLVEEDVRGSFAAISELAGFWARLLPCDPDNPAVRESVGVIAEGLEEMACALRLALAAQADDEETETG